MSDAEDLWRDRQALRAAHDRLETNMRIQMGILICMAIALVGSGFWYFSHIDADIQLLKYQVTYILGVLEKTHFIPMPVPTVPH